MTLDSIPKRLFDRAKATPARPGYLVKQGGVWKATDWAGYAREVTQAARALVALGFQPGQRTCILGFNRPEWVILDLATMAAGGAPAGIYTTCSPEEVQYIVEHSEAPLVLVENADQLKKIEKKKDELKGTLKYVVVMRGTTPTPIPGGPTVLGWEDFLSRGDVTPEKEVHARVEALRPDQQATLIYTSGTTGPPKAVELTHENLAWTASVLRDLTRIEENGRGLSYLPLSHIAEQMATIHGPITGGSAVYFAESLDPQKLVQNLTEVRPTLFFGVPRIWEKFHANIAGKMAQATGAKARIVRWARGVGTEVSRLRAEGKQPSGMLAIEYRIADRMVFSAVKKALGLDQATCLVSGAAPIGRDVIEFLASIDLLVQEIYGQSEGTGPTTFNLEGRTKFGTVGVPLPGVNVRIAEDGEILFKGKNVFSGYFKDPAATKETIDAEGWLHSGDLGAFDAQGFLSITGRKKEIIITAGGKNITPKNIEAAIKESSLVAEAVVIGDRRKYLTALVWLEPEATKKWMEQKGLSGDPQKSAEVRAEIQKAIDAANEKLARVEQIKKFALPARPMSIETGELTPTLKIKRSKVAAHFAADIEAMYEGDKD